MYSDVSYSSFARNLATEAGGGGDQQTQRHKQERAGHRGEPGPSVIAALHHGRGDIIRIHKKPPFDLLYGYRGGADAVDLLSAYEMLLHYSIERILPPTTTRAWSRAAWTEEGKKYAEECRAARARGNCKPGEHYVAIEGEDRILLPNLRDLYG